LVWLAVGLTREESIKLTIRDNGVGFDPAGLAGAVRRGHLGLKQMRERVEGAGGTLEIDSQPGEGTEVRIVLPLA
jgi:two-component system NarL family sensor kinase